MLSLALGVPIGIGASFLAWWIVQHIIIPKVTFSEHISRTEYGGNPSGYSYRVKFQNNGKRDVIDAEVFATVRIRGLSRRDNGLTEIANIPVDSERIPIIKAGANRIIHVNIHEATRFTKLIYGNDINLKCKDRTLTLDDILSAGEHASLTIHIFGYDRWSGARKIYESIEYQSTHVLSGRWDGMQILNTQQDHEKTNC